MSPTIGPNKVKERRCGNKGDSEHNVPAFFVNSIIGAAPQVTVDDNNKTMRTFRRTNLLVLPEIARVKAHISKGLTNLILAQLLS